MSHLTLEPLFPSLSSLRHLFPQTHKIFNSEISQRCITILNKIITIIVTSTMCQEMALRALHIHSHLILTTTL